MAIPLPLASTRTVLTTPEVDAMIADNCPVAIGVSGGKDSTAVAFATQDYLDAIGHSGPRVLIHSDLGDTEWRDSLPTCQRLADRLGLELMVVRRQKGDMMDRWEQRWDDNKNRYLNLSCVKLILPWSTPDMRFCTSELKIDIICRALSERFRNQRILNVTGIRREESSQRAKSPVASVQKKLTSVTRGTSGMAWNPILDWTIADVFGIAAERDFPMHEAYEKYGSSRVSCVWCILATQADHLAGARAVENLPLARRMVELEARSTFAFQGTRWLGDTLEAVLPIGLIQDVQMAKSRAERRVAAEAKIPDHLLYTKGWPTCVPTRTEAENLALIRREVSQAVGISPTFCIAKDIIDRYEELMSLKPKSAG
jgi:3'-phosphoadenosine 5'-phosphosulfate sulfotransferase (PAPS reductase)/FAD synthetase